MTLDKDPGEMTPHELVKILVERFDAIQEEIADFTQAFDWVVGSSPSKDTKSATATAIGLHLMRDTLEGHQREWLQLHAELPRVAQESDWLPAGYEHINDTLQKAIKMKKDLAWP